MPHDLKVSVVSLDVGYPMFHLPSRINLSEIYLRNLDPETVIKVSKNVVFIQKFPHICKV